jgi:type IV pilus assembly protein PilM
MGLLVKSESYLGIDIGSTSVKIVELKKESGKIKLLTYGFSENLPSLEKVDNKQMESIISRICDDSGTKSKNAVAALPTFSVFSSIIDLPKINEKDMASAINWEAKKVIPMSLEEMILSWQIIQKTPEEEAQNSNHLKILLTGAPKTLVKRHIDIFKSCQINLISIETETFALARSLVGNDPSPAMIIEMGANTTDLSIINNGIPVLSRSLDLGGFTISRAIASNLDIDIERAEQFKYDLGISNIESQSDVIPKTIIESITPVVNEITYSLGLFQSKNNRQVEKIILSGGSSLLINFSNYLSKLLNLNVIIGNPWARISYPLELKPLLDEIGPRMSIATGLAMRELE